MRHITAAGVSVLVACLALAGTGYAQTYPYQPYQPYQQVQVQGTIQSVDCQSGQVTLSTAGGSESFQASNQTAAYVNGSSVSLCSLQSYTGDSATATLVPTGNALALSQINVTAQAAPSTGGSILSSPVAVGVGALLLGGLIGYFLGHQNQPQTPVYTPYGDTATPYGSPYTYNGQTYYYYPSGYAPTYLPAQYPNNRAFWYQGQRYYRCNDGSWNAGQTCETRER